MGAKGAGRRGASRKGAGGGGGEKSPAEAAISGAAPSGPATIQDAILKEFARLEPEHADPQIAWADTQVPIHTIRTGVERLVPGHAPGEFDAAMRELQRSGKLRMVLGSDTREFSPEQLSRSIPAFGYGHHISVERMSKN